jgi:hypothetical protein
MRTARSRVVDPFDMISKDNMKLPAISPCIRVGSCKYRAKQKTLFSKPIVTELPVLLLQSERQSKYRRSKKTAKPPTPYFSFSQDDIDLYKPE